MVEQRYHPPPYTLKRGGLMTAAAPPPWNLFKQIFADHWDGFKRAHPRYDRRYYDGLVEKMLGCGNPDQMGYIDYRCLHCGEGTHRVAMSCKSSLCLRCAKVYVNSIGFSILRLPCSPRSARVSEVGKYPSPDR